jgi:hypothetical protein
MRQVAYTILIDVGRGYTENAQWAASGKIRQPAGEIVAPTLLPATILPISLNLKNY